MGKAKAHLGLIGTAHPRNAIGTTRRWHAMAKSPVVPVEVGQIWKDADKRIPDRYVKVQEIVGQHAYCSICTPDGVSLSRSTRISIARMKPTSTGYALYRPSVPVEEGAAE